MNYSKLQLLIAAIAVLIAGGLWYERFADVESENSSPAPGKVIAALEPAPVVSAPIVSAPIVSAPISVSGVAPVLTTINWADPANPAAIPLSRGILMDTREGLKFFDANTFELRSLDHPLAGVRLLDKIWMHTNRANVIGTLFAVQAISPKEQATLYWLREGKAKIENRLELPQGFLPSALVRLSDDSVLLCTATKRAIAVGRVDGELKLLAELPPADALLGALREARVVGPVEGIGELSESQVDGKYSKRPPLYFDARRCGWIGKNLPEPMASGLGLEFDYLQSAAMIVAATWRDPLTNEPRALNAPLKWDFGDQQWISRQAADFPGLPLDHMAGVLHTGWSYAASPSQGRFAFLAPVDDRWRESTQRFPAAEGLKLLRIGNEGVLALLISATQPGQVVRLDPEPQKWANQRLNKHFSHFATAVPMAKGELMIVNGLYASLITPGNSDVESLPALPKVQTRVSGIQLADTSAVFFGGLARSCHATDLPNCKQGAQASFRWIPAEKRWQPLPTLSVLFDYGEIFDGGNSGITTSYQRNDFLLHEGRTIYYLSSEKIKWTQDHLPEETRLHRWNLDTSTSALSATQLSRLNVSLLELNDGRLAAIGGLAANEPLSPACKICEEKRQVEIARLKEKSANAPEPADNGEEGELDPEQMVPPCEPCEVLRAYDHFGSARTCETYEIDSNRWTLGPFSNHPGGRAIKLANGRLFKFGLLGYNATDALYAAETADPELKAWTQAPPFPFGKKSLVSDIWAIGNQVLIVMAKPGDRYVLWDDSTRDWQVFPLPRHADWSPRNLPAFISAASPEKILMVYPRIYEYLPWPLP